MKKNKLKKYFILSVLIFLGHFCFGQFLEDEPFPVVHLKKDSTHIILEDYFPNIKETGYRITHEPAGMDVRVFNNYEIILYGKPQNLIDYLGVSVNFIERGIPIKMPQEKVLEKKNFITTQSFTKENNLEIYRSYPATRLLAFINNRPVEEKYFTFHGQQVFMKIPEFVENFSTASLHIYAYDFKQTTNDILLPLSHGIPIENANILTTKDYHSNIIYSLMIDRFKNGDRSNDKPFRIAKLSPEKDWNGGDLKGIEEILDKNYFKQMGVNALILSPIFQKTNELFNINNETFAAYQGKSPMSWSKIEPRFGENVDFHKIIGKAHLKKMNVFLGNIVHHFPQQNALVIEHPEWQDKLIDHSEFSENTPSIALNLKIPEVSKIIRDSLTHIYDVYPIDGFAHLDTDLIPTDFWIKLSQQINHQVAIPQRRSFFQISQSSKGSHEFVDAGLNTSYDIDLFHATRSVFLKGQEVQKLSEKLKNRLNQWGSHHLLANISGNEFNARNASVVKDFLRGSSSDAVLSKVIAWDRMKQFFAFNLTIPGIPVLYYGDEIGLKGDDNKAQSLMKFSGLTNEEKDFRNFVAGLNKLRRNNMALMYGETEVLQSFANTLIYTRSYLNNKIIVAFNNSNETRSFEVELPTYMKNHEFRGGYFTPVENRYRKILFTLPPHGFEIFMNK